MIKNLLLVGLLVGAAGAAAAQPATTPSPYAPLADKPSCTSAELKSATDAYVEAQRTGDISGLPLAANAHFLENMQTVARDKGLWNTKLPVADAISFHDPKRCKTFTQIIVTQGGHPYVIGTRLYLNDGKIIRVDSLVTDKGDWLFNANAYLKYSTKEDWGDLSKYQKTPPSEMIRGANAYLSSFSDKFMDVPWGTPCARLEGGAYTNRNGDPQASCEVGIPAGVLYIVNRDYLIDEDKGVINVFCRFGDSRGRHARLPHLPLHRRQDPRRAYAEREPGGDALASGRRQRRHRGNAPAPHEDALSVATGAMTKDDAIIGVSDHAGWAVLVTVAGDGTLLDTRRVELVDEGLSNFPYHHGAQGLPIDEGVALVERVRLSAERLAKLGLEIAESAVRAKVRAVALRAHPPMPPTVAERIQSYWAQTKADTIMYRHALAEAAQARGWAVHWFDAKAAIEEAGRALGGGELDRRFAEGKARFYPPWTQDHRLAMAAALALATT